MFSEAYELASGFTHPVIILTRQYDGVVNCGIGGFVLVNAEGWFLSAAHILEAQSRLDKGKEELAAYEEQKQEIETHPTWADKYKRNKLKGLQVSSDLITHISYWWGADNLVTEPLFRIAGDLMVGRFTNFHPNPTQKHPVFKNPVNLKPGTSLCKLGFPFHEAKAEFVESDETFLISPETLPVPRFPIEGIFTRTITTQEVYSQGCYIKWIETSSPGLRGQSGGSVFDRHGVVWGIQSHTTHIHLGFDPAVKRGNHEVVESQFLNLGIGVHPEVIVNVLTELGVSFELTSD